MDIVSTYKQSTNKFSAVEKIAVETGMKPKDIFLELLNAHAIDGRMFRQGRYKDDWTAAKKEYKNGNINTAKEATTSLEALKKENAELKRLLENAEVPESYQKTIEIQSDEINKLNALIDEKDKEYQETYAQMKDEYEAAEKIIKLREEQLNLNDKQMEEMEQTIANLTKQLEHHKVSDFNATTDAMQMELKVKNLEAKISEYEVEIQRLNSNDTRHVEYIRGLEEQLEEEAPSNGETLSRQLSETTQNYNEAMLINKKLEEQINLLEEEKESDGLIIEELIKSRDTLSAKLTKCEAYILNQVIYS